MAIPPLAGYTVAVTADRRAEEQVALLERRGADVVVGATVRTLPLVDDEALRTAMDDVIASPPDALVLLTGIGTRGLIAAAEGAGRDGELIDALARCLVIARGPKSAGAATTAGIGVGWQAPSERSSEIVEHLASAARGGARIAVQRDGNREPLLGDALRELGAEVIDIPVYRWEMPEDTRPAQRIVDAIVAREVDAVTFTSRPAVEGLVAVARQSGRTGALLVALAGAVIPVCVGPVCAEGAAEVGIATCVIPRRARLGAMVQALVAHLAGSSRSISTASGAVVIQGRGVFVEESPAPLGPRERAVLEVLLSAAGAVVPKSKLLRDVWGEGFADEHAVEVAVGRLRRGLGPVGRAVETVPRRGYRLG